MSKGNHASTQHLPSKKPLMQTRESPPVLAKDTKGNIELRCPFCDDHHILVAGEESACGARVEVRVIQEVVSARLSRVEGLTCVKCHKNGGDMVRYRNGFIHAFDCSPQTKLLQEIPKMSVLAKFVYQFPPKVRGLVERLTGPSCQVQEIDEHGNKTGKVIGYSFWRNNAQHPAASTR